MQVKGIRRRQRAAFERDAAGVSDLGAAEVEHLELRQPSRSGGAALSRASCTAAFAVALAGMSYMAIPQSAGSAPLSSAAATAAQPASVIWVQQR